MSSASRAAPKRPQPSRRSPRGHHSWWRSPWLLAGTFVAVTAIVAVLLAAGLGGGSPRSTNAGTASGSTALAPPSVVDAATHVPASALAAAGYVPGTTPFVNLPPNAPSLTADGKPLFAVVGADYCPFCAGRRWSIVVALSRFGTFSNLGATTSASEDIYPNTPSFSFHGAGYSSQYISFVGVERQTRDGQPLDTPSADVAQQLSLFDVPPYTAQANSIPFLDAGGRLVSIGGGYSPAVLQGMTMEQIGAALSNPQSAAGQAILADANLITAAVCSITGNQPASVCTAAPIPAIVSTLSGR